MCAPGWNARDVKVGNCNFEVAPPDCTGKFGFTSQRICVMSEALSEKWNALKVYTASKANHAARPGPALVLAAAAWALVRAMPPWFMAGGPPALCTK